MTRIALLLVALLTLGMVEQPAQETSRESELLRSVPCLRRAGESNPIPESANGCARADMVKLLRQLAGPHAVNCGDIGRGADRSTAFACIEQRLKEGSPLFAVLDVQGIDSCVAKGVVRTAEGSLRMLTWTSDAYGGGCEPKHPEMWLQECGRIEVDQSQGGRNVWDPFKCLDPGS